MKKKERLKIKKKIHDFSFSLILEFRKNIDSIKHYQPDIEKSLPTIFYKDNLDIKAYYSEDRRHIMILFQPSNQYTPDAPDKFHFIPTTGNVINPLDATGKWAKEKGALIDICGGAELNMAYFDISGRKPFNLRGEGVKLELINTIFSLPMGRMMVNYGLILSESIFEEMISNVKDYVQNKIYTYWDYYKRKNKPIDSSDKKTEQKNEYKKLLDQMEKLFFAQDVGEGEIDDFLTDNPEILRITLSLSPVTFIKKPELENIIKSDFDQNLIPDLICRNYHGDWVLLDYKRSKRIIKKEGTARADVTSEVNDLKTQLKNYREYFFEAEHRKRFKESFNIEDDMSTRPDAIGIIGNVSDSERATYKKGIEDFPNWIKIYTYNEVHAMFKQFCDGI